MKIWFVVWKKEESICCQLTHRRSWETWIDRYRFCLVRVFPNFEVFRIPFSMVMLLGNDSRQYDWETFRLEMKTSSMETRHKYFFWDWCLVKPHPVKISLDVFVWYVGCLLKPLNFPIFYPDHFQTVFFVQVRDFLDFGSLLINFHVSHNRFK